MCSLPAALVMSPTGAPTSGTTGLDQQGTRGSCGRPSKEQPRQEPSISPHSSAAPMARRPHVHTHVHKARYALVAGQLSPPGDEMRCCLGPLAFTRASPTLRPEAKMGRLVAIASLVVTSSEDTWDSLCTYRTSCNSLRAASFAIVS